MADITENIKSNLITILITALCSFLGFLLIGILSDFLPAILPSLQKLPIILYLRIILLLLTLLALAIAIVIVLAFRLKPSQPHSEKGEIYGIPWTAEVDYAPLKKGQEILIKVFWLCPIHKAPSDKRQDSQGTQGIYCSGCKKFYYLSHKGATFAPDEAYVIVRHKILNKITLPTSL